VELFGLQVPDLALNASVSAIAAAIVVLAWRAAERFLQSRRPADAPAMVEPAIVAAPQVVATPLAQQRAAVLGELHAVTASCEESLRKKLAENPDSFRDGEIAFACKRALSSLRRKRPWLTPATAQRVDEVSTSYDELATLLQLHNNGDQSEDPKQRQRIDGSIDGVVKGISLLRERLESEFRASSGLFHLTSKE
jgi:hypothetical protein